MELDKIQEIILNYSDYEKVGKYGVTSLEKPRYKAWVEENNPDVDCTKPINYIDSRIGTGFHKVAEEALKNTDEISCSTEVKLSGDIGGYEVGGTCDLIVWEEGNVGRICDFKTMKSYPAKKAFNGEELDKFKHQLSIYAYLVRQYGNKVSDVGYIYVFVVGWTARDRELPRTFRIEIPLMTDEEVEAYVKERIEGLENPEMDCPSWMCSQYCNVNCVCPHYNNHEFKDTKK